MAGTNETYERLDRDVEGGAASGAGRRTSEAGASQPKLRPWLLVGGLVLVGVLIGLVIHFAGRSGSSCAAPPENERRYVVIVSIDGFRHDYMEMYSTPNLHKLAKSGVRAKIMRPIFPSNTFPNHYTLVTGLYAESHGIVGNSMFDPDTGKYFSLSTSSVQESMWWGGEPIWVTAEKFGRKSGTAYWPGSEAEIKGVRPTYWLRYNDRPSDQKSIDQILQWMDLNDTARPTFFSGYMSQVDTRGHSHGPNSEEVRLAVEEVDRLIGHLVAGLEERGVRDQTDIIVVSDHGMTELSTDRRIYLDDYSNRTEYRIVNWSPITDFWPNEGMEDKVYNDLVDKHPNYKVYRKADLPDRYHYFNNKRVGPIIGVADNGWTVTARDRTYNNKGTHGYDYLEPDMGAIFIASGPGFKEGVELEELYNIDVYPLLCWRLNIQPAPNNGSLDRLLPVLNLDSNAPHRVTGTSLF